MPTLMEPATVPTSTAPRPGLALEPEPVATIWITVQPVSEQPATASIPAVSLPVMTDRLEDATWEDAEWR